MYAPIVVADLKKDPQDPKKQALWRLCGVFESIWAECLLHLVIGNLEENKSSPSGRRSGSIQGGLSHGRSFLDQKS